jgi:hypothetical protein
MSGEPDKARKALEALVIRVSDALRSGVSAGRVVPLELPITRWKLTSPLEFDDNGTRKGGRRSETRLEKSWAFAASAAAQGASETEEFRAAAAAMASTYHIGDFANQHLTQFLNTVARTVLEPELASRPSIDSLAAVFLDQLNGKPIRYGAEIDLQGIVLDIDQVEPELGIVIRRPVIDDFEREADFNIGWQSSEPTAIVRIDRVGVNANDLQRAMNRLVVVLRLFCIASVKWLCMRQFSESMIGAGSFTLSNGPHEIVLHVGKINSQNRRKLESFWSQIDSSLSVDFPASPGAESDYLAIAYERYCGALTRPGLLEERIAQAVMGLEAILLNENLELAYKVRVRAAKLLSFFGEDAIHVSDVLKDAYSVRSTFAHGDRLSYKRTKKLNEKYKPASNLLEETLEILRKALVTGILSRKGKDPLIDMIDHALIDQQRHTALENQLRALRQYV